MTKTYKITIKMKSGEVYIWTASGKNSTEAARHAITGVRLSGNKGDIREVVAREL